MSTDAKADDFDFLLNLRRGTEWRHETERLFSAVQIARVLEKVENAADALRRTVEGAPTEGRGEVVLLPIADFDRLERLAWSGHAAAHAGGYHEPDAARSGSRVEIQATLNGWVVTSRNFEGEERQEVFSSFAEVQSRFSDTFGQPVYGAAAWLAMHAIGEVLHAAPTSGDAANAVADIVGRFKRGELERLECFRPEGP